MWFMNDLIKNIITLQFCRTSTRFQRRQRLYLIYILYRNKYVNMILHSHLFDYSKIVLFDKQE